MSSLELALIGNCAIAGLVDRKGRIVWTCWPRLDGDPIFHALLGTSTDNPHDGAFTIELEGFARSEQVYDENTAIVRTRLFNSDGDAIEIADFMPRFEARGRSFRPTALVRRVRPIAGRPRIRVRCRPRFDWGRITPAVTTGSNHIRYVGGDVVLRLNTNAPITYLREETAFLIDRSLSFYLGPDETLTDGADTLCRMFEENTAEHWRRWTRRLSLPFEWQEAVIRAAITLKLNTFEETGAIIAAVTTSVPEAANTSRNWDYRYCWLRDAFFVIRALNSLSEMETMENYLRYLQNVIAGWDGGEHFQPLYGIALERHLTEEIVDLPGYRGMGPVRVGNQAWEHHQYDVYGNIVLGAAQAFVDKRLLNPAGVESFAVMERIGEEAFRCHDRPDAGMWELRFRARVHTTSSLMCWAALDRLAKVAQHLGLGERASYWRGRAETVRAAIMDKGWNNSLGTFVESFGGNDLDAGLLLMAEVNFIDPKDPRFVATVDAIAAKLRRGNHMFRYHAADDFGEPENAFNICTFWYIDALARMGRRDEAREIYETMLACRNHVGLLSEDVTTATGELWGNFPQTYSMVGIINGAVRLSGGWDRVV
ncbi:glycoside hydrolase family 15 protein [Methylobrevis pamukkalensis]|uniref:Trehalase n=1 Tax=Methylobrevis pamukkalensis TaxID=1439726 RepID=A0A1E3H3C4_9HYPH|nr:glycoside hydrolase family 15 protein [Methylobrevis pamukkalensis]ODN70784.1 Trehalase [Methylobrevis pamukkalensis]